jgi:uncharacterized protein YcfL
MKKITAILGLIIFLLVSCSESNDINCNNNNFKYQIIDTTNISKNGFNMVLGYDVIIRIDTSYYSASLRKNGKINYIHRKLNTNNIEKK